MSKIMKKAAAFLAAAGMALVMICGALPARPAMAETSGDFEYSVNYDDTATITGYTGSGGEVTVPGELDGHKVSAIGRWAFAVSEPMGNVSPTSVTLPEGVRSIGEYAFDGCSSLASVTLPEGVRSIGAYAFVGCSSLTSITLPDSVNSIGINSFTDTGYYKDPGNWEDGILYIGNHLIKADGEKVSGVFDIRQGTKSIAADAFNGCSSLTAVTIPDSVTEICSYTFEGCSGITSMKLPDSVIKIGMGAFSGCTGLTSITIPDSVTEIQEDAFKDCTGLTMFTIPDDLTSISGTAFINTGYYNDSRNWEDGVLYVGDYLMDVKSEELPAEYAIRPGTRMIAGDAFFGETGLKTVTIPDSLVKIGGGAFMNCTSLTSVNIPESVTEIGGSAFMNCMSLTSVNIPESVTEIGGYAFSGCTGLTTMKIPDGVTEISDNIFEYCSGLISVEIPEGLKKIGSNCFNGCSSLASVEIPKGVTVIGFRAFRNCNALTSVEMPEGLKKIGSSCFEGCSGLTSVTIPDGVQEIGYWTFFRCTGLTKVEIPESVTHIWLDSFDLCGDGLTIYGYAGSYAEYYVKEEAKIRHFNFVALPKLSDAVTGIVIKGTEETLPAGLELTAAQTESIDTAVTYEISLTKDGQEVQPSGSVTVEIPVPESMNGKEIAVYRVEANGSRTDMNAKVRDGYAVFATDHFSRYVLQVVTYGDVDGSGEVDSSDALAILRFVVKLQTPTAAQTKVANVDGIGGVDSSDALMVLRKVVKLIESFPVEQDGSGQ